MKMPATQWEARFATHITNTGLVLKIQKYFLNIIKNKQTESIIEKWARDLNQYFHKRGYPNDKWIEKVPTH